MKGEIDMSRTLVPNDNEVLLTFLEKTKNGDYVAIEQSSLDYIRVKEQDESQNILEDLFSYCLS
jgi:hypothetical protein